MATSTPAVPYLSSVVGFQHSSPSIQYVRDDTMVWDNGGVLITGGFRPMTVADAGGSSVTTLDSTISSGSAAIVTRSLLMGARENGSIVNVPVTAEGHLETVIHGPRNPFGSIHTENLTPIFQVDGVYGVNNQMVRATTGLGGTLTNVDSQFVMQTNTSAGGNATFQTRKRLRYRPGQGAVGRFTARFTSGVPNSVQIAGMGHAEDGIYFGYSGASFGVLHSLAGIREVQTLSLTASASVTANASVTLDGTNFSIPLSNSANPYRTAYEISTGTYAGWTTEAIGSGVIFVSSSAGPKTAPFLFSGLTTNAAGTFTETRGGGALTETWIPQAQWNNDPMNGAGPSAMVLDPTKGNVYQIGYQYLGYGTLTFQIESPGNGNNPDWTTVHVVRYPNTSVTPNFRNPSFPLTVSAYSLGSTTNLTVNTASIAGFVEGQKILNGPQFTYNETSAAVTAAAFKAIFTVRNNLVYKAKSSQCVVNLVNFNAAAKHTQPVTLYLLKNAALAGNPNFQSYATDSCTSYDNSATTATITDNSQLLFSFSIADNGQDSFDLKELGFDLQPGESVTVAGKTSGGGTATFVSASLNTREDQ